MVMKGTSKHLTITRKYLECSSPFHVNSPDVGAISSSVLVGSGGFLLTQMVLLSHYRINVWLYLLDLPTVTTFFGLHPFLHLRRPCAFILFCLSKSPLVRIFWWQTVLNFVCLRLCLLWDRSSELFSLNLEFTVANYLLIPHWAHYSMVFWNPLVLMKIQLSV